MASTIQVRVEDELKRKSDALFKDLGTDTTTAIRMFLTQAVATNGFPFEIKRQTESNPYAPMTEKEILQFMKNIIYINNIIFNTVKHKISME